MNHGYYDDYDPNEEWFNQGPQTPEEYHAYDSDIMWGGSDKISIVAMWAGDPAAEIYCWDKANRLGGYPWDEGVLVHASYENSNSSIDIDLVKIIFFGILLYIVASCVVILMS